MRRFVPRRFATPALDRVGTSSNGPCTPRERRKRANATADRATWPRCSPWWPGTPWSRRLHSTRFPRRCLASQSWRSSIGRDAARPGVVQRVRSGNATSARVVARSVRNAQVSGAHPLARPALAPHDRGLWLVPKTSRAARRPVTNTLRPIARAATFLWADQPARSDLGICALGEGAGPLKRLPDPDTIVRGCGVDAPGQ